MAAEGVRVVGMTVNTIALRIAFPESCTWKELLHDTWQVAREGYARQECAWDDVVRANLRAHQAQSAQLYSFGHGTHWLAYGLVQQGKVREARAWVDSMLALARERLQAQS